MAMATEQAETVSLRDRTKWKAGRSLSPLTSRAEIADERGTQTFG
ncbi:hypothetical protein [Streptomyces radicis]|nr:hypothetical protein [Streptomyces radicis]